MKPILIILLMAVILVQMMLSVNAAPDRVLYELQERCATRAEQIFAKGWPNGSPDKSMGYISHYNVTLNKCFMLEIVNAFNPKHPTLLKILLDVNSNKEYGEFFGNMPGHKSSDLYPMCFLGEKFCASEAEWDAMAGVYMEEDGTGK